MVASSNIHYLKLRRLRFKFSKKMEYKWPVFECRLLICFSLTFGEVVIIGISFLQWRKLARGDQCGFPACDLKGQDLDLGVQTPSAALFPLSWTVFIALWSIHNTQAMIPSHPSNYTLKVNHSPLPSDKKNELVSPSQFRKDSVLPKVVPVSCLEIPLECWPGELTA